MTKQPTPERILQLSLGKSASSNLTESLKINFSMLMSELLNENVIVNEKQGIIGKMKYCSELLLERLGKDHLYELKNHSSDTVRGFAIFGLAKEHSNSSVSTVLEFTRPFAKDKHFGVREWACIATKPILVKTLQQSISKLVSWTGEKDVNLRRFAVEVLRPRGVWCKHITELRQNPELGLPILEPMRYETEKYAQDSVSNWLNDASKDNPTWVNKICDKWQKESPNDKNTKRIIKRATRTILKNQQ